MLALHRLSERASTGRLEGLARTRRADRRGKEGSWISFDGSCHRFYGRDWRSDGGWHPSFGCFGLWFGGYSIHFDPVLRHADLAGHLAADAFCRE